MLSIKDIMKLEEERTKCRKLCKNCGHSILLGRKDKIICHHCGKYVFKDDKAEFEYRMKQSRIKQKQN